MSGNLVYVTISDDKKKVLVSKNQESFDFPQDKDNSSKILTTLLKEGESYTFHDYFFGRNESCDAYIINNSTALDKKEMHFEWRTYSEIFNKMPLLHSRVLESLVNDEYLLNN